MVNHRLCKTLSAAALVLGSQGALAAPVLQYSGTDLLGATGVSVNSQLYDVQFDTRSCNAIFGSCANTAPNGFAFLTSADATAAANALLNEIGGTPFQAASQIGGTSSATLTNIATPYAVGGGQVVVEDFGFRSSTVSAGNLSPEIVARSYNAAYAVWSVDTANVPEPASAAMLAAGVAALAAARRRRRRKA